MFLRWLLLLVCTLSVSFFSTARAADIALSDYFIETWTSKTGLPHNSINAISQTRDGYLWFATWEGVARYDGLDFKLYNRSPETGMRDSGTKSLMALSDNRLLVAGARGSLTERKGFTWQGHRPASNLINHAIEDSQGNLWLAIEGQGIEFRPDAGDTQRPAERLLPHSSYRLLESGAFIYAATDQGVYRFNAETRTHKQLFTDAPFRQVLYLAEDNSGNLLLGTDQGAWRWDGQQLELLAPELSKDKVTLIETDRQGYIWLGTINRGIGRLQGSKLSFINTRDGLPNNRIWSWYQDLEGSIWVGTSGGLMRLRQAPFVSITERKGLAGNYVRTLLALSDNQVLAGSSNGLSLIQDAGRNVTSLPYGETPLSVLSLASDRQGGVWIGTYQRGLFYWQPGKAIQSVWQKDTGLINNEIRAILQDRNGNLWIGTAAGLMLKHASGKIYSFTTDNSELPGNFVMALAEDELGQIWIGTGVGVTYIRPGDVTQKQNWQPLKLKPYDDAEYAFGFYTEPGYVWMATDRGIVRYRQDDGSLGIIGRQAGLPNDKFFQVIKDHQQHFWLSSNRGIWKISAREAHDVLDGRRDSIRFEHFSEADGMASGQANGGSNPAAVRASDNRLYFATAEGVAVLQPEELASMNEYTMPVVVQGVRFDNRQINPDQQHQVPAGTHRLQFNYVGLSYTMSDRLEYRTRLAGFDNTWVYRGRSNIAEYTNLAPGDYQFQVSVRYPYGEWHNTGDLYQFQVQPHWWQQTSVQALFAILILLLIGGAVYGREYHLRRNAARLEKLVAEKTSALQQQSAEFERLSREDTLTSLPNRRAFDSRLQQLIRELTDETSLYLAVIDIDHFKQINDQHSHLIGDKVIQQVAAELKAHAFTDSDTARWGGEEFTLIFRCKRHNRQQASDYFERLRQAIADAPVGTIAEGLKVTVSIGVAAAEGQAHYDDLVRRADHALLAAKRNGRNQVIMAS